jgi:predicted MPP superfamily phosphohydrolase
VKKLSRRQILGGGAVAAMGMTAVDALAVEPHWLDVTEWVVEVPELPSELEGFTIAHVTDVHLTSLGRLHEAIARALAARVPDLVVVTGDVIDGDEHLGLVAPFVERLRAGGSRIVATLGNWEHWGGVNLRSLDEAYAKAGARLLVNENMSVGRGLVVVATDDGASGNADVGRAFRDAPEQPRVLLSHAPGVFDGPLPANAGAAVSLAGHTHGGQMTALTKAVWVPPGSGRFVAGPYETAVGHLYVSRGIGTSVVPARLFCRPEMVVLRLRRGSRSCLLRATG